MHWHSGSWRRDLRHCRDLNVVFKHFLWLFNNFFRLGVHRRKITGGRGAGDVIWMNRRTSNRLLRSSFGLELLQHFHWYVQMPHTDVIGVSSSPGINRRIFHQITWAPDHIRNECACSQQQHQPAGLGVLQDTNHCMVEWLSLNQTERETAWGESALCYSMGGRFKRTVFKNIFWGWDG